MEADDYKEGLSIMESVKAVFEKIGDNTGTARCFNALGVIYSNLGIYDLALDYYRDSVKVLKEVDLQNFTGTVYMNTADCLYELGESEEALKTFQRCSQEYFIPPRNMAAFHRTGGLIYHSLGRQAEAESEFKEAIKFSKGWLLMELPAKQALIELYMDSGRLDEAHQLIEAGIEAASQSNDQYSYARFRLVRARMSMMKDRPLEAIPDIRTAILMARELGLRKIEADAEKIAFIVWQSCGEYAKALDALISHHRLMDAIKSEQTSQRINALHDERSRTEALHFEHLYKQISSISEIGQRITANLDLEVTFETIYDAINGLMNAPTLLIAVVDEEEGCLEYRLVIIQGERKTSFRYPLSAETLGCWCVNQRSDILIGDVKYEYRQYLNTFEDFLVDGTKEQSLVFVPLIVGDKVKGVLSVQSHLLNAYDKRSVETIRAIGAYIAIAIENAKLFQQIQNFATNDGLTGLLNRRCLTEVINERYFDTKQCKLIAGIIMVDIDHFKKVNDTYGHIIGDEVLRSLAKVFTEALRDCDSIGRFGGEEFVILLPETSLEESGIIAERIRKTIESLKIQIPEGGSFGVTASFGVSVIHPNDPNYEVILKRVDKALYNAKQSGRNCVSMEAVD